MLQDNDNMRETQTLNKFMSGPAKKLIYQPNGEFNLIFVLKLSLGSLFIAIYLSILIGPTHRFHLFNYELLVFGHTTNKAC